MTRQTTTRSVHTNGRASFGSIPLHGADLLQKLPAQDLRYILNHRSQVRALVKAKSKPVAKATPAVRPIDSIRLRALVVAMGFKSASAMAEALKGLDGRSAPRTPRARKRQTHRWSRRRLFPEKRSAIIEDCRAGVLTIDQMATKHKVSQATISRIKRDEGLVGVKAAKAAKVAETPVTSAPVASVPATTEPVHA